MAKLGILVNTDKNLEHVIGICGAAKAAGIEVSIFIMDDGCFLTKEPRFLALAKQGVSMTLCDHSFHEKGLTGKVEGVTHGSQFDHASIAHECDRFIVL